MIKIDATDAAIADAVPAASQEVESQTLDDQFKEGAINALARFRQAMERVIYSITKSLQNSRDLQSILGVDRYVFDSFLHPCQCFSPEGIVSLEEAGSKPGRHRRSARRFCRL